MIMLHKKVWLHLYRVPHFCLVGCRKAKRKNRWLFRTIEIWKYTLILISSLAEKIQAICSRLFQCRTKQKTWSLGKRRMFSNQQIRRHSLSTVDIFRDFGIDASSFINSLGTHSTSYGLQLFHCRLWRRINCKNFYRKWKRETNCGGCIGRIRMCWTESNVSSIEDARIISCLVENKIKYRLNSPNCPIVVKEEI